jgi:hypothetical protein
MVNGKSYVEQEEYFIPLLKEEEGLYIDPRPIPFYAIKPDENVNYDI